MKKNKIKNKENKKKTFEQKMSKIPKSRLALPKTTVTNPLPIVVTPPPPPPITIAESPPPPEKKSEEELKEVPKQIEIIVPKTETQEEAFAKNLEAIVAALQQQKESEQTAVVDIIRNMQKVEIKRPQYPLAQKMKRANNKKLCVYIGMDAAEYNSETTLSWCLADPATANKDCNIQFCFHVPRVREYIATFTKDSVFDKDVPFKEIPMYKRDDIQRTFSKHLELRDYSVPEFMTFEFRSVIETFDQLARDSFGRKLLRAPFDYWQAKNDSFARNVVQGCVNFLQEQIKTTGSTGGFFWRYTKRLVLGIASNVAKLTLFVMDHPFFSMIIITVLKTLRIAICVYTSFFNGTKDVVQIFKDRYTKNLTGFSKFILETGLDLAVCLASSTLFADFTNCVSLVGENSLKLLTIAIRQIIASTLASFGWTSISGALVKVVTNPKLFLSAVFGFGTSTNPMLTVGLLQQLRTQNWNVVVIATILTLIPTATLHNLFDKFVAILPSPHNARLKTITYLSMKLGLHPVTIIARLMGNRTIGQEMNALVEAFYELEAWIFDVFPCLVHYLTNMIRCSMGMEGCVSPAAGATCCLADLINQIQKHAAEETLLRRAETVAAAQKALGKAVGAVYTSAKYVGGSIYDGMASVGSYLGSTFYGEAPSMEETKDIIGHLVTENPWMFENDAQMQDALVEFLETDKEKVPDIFYKRFAPKETKTYYDRMWAVLSDEREKTNLMPLFTLVVPEDGNQIDFYLFEWKEDAIFQDGYKMHISVMAQDIARLYPNAVFNYHDRLFVLLDHLPPIVVKHILLFRNPIVDLRRFLET